MGQRKRTCIWRTLILCRPVVAAAILIFGSGCGAMKGWQNKDEFAKLGDGVPSAALSSTVTGADRNTVVQAQATVPATPTPTPATTPSQSSFSKMMGMAPKPEKKVPAAEIVLVWRNKMDFLPDPTRNGAMGPGLAGQMFLFGPGMQAAQAEGKLTVSLYDETPRQPGQPLKTPEVWEFSKEALKGLRTPDERFGMCYALFLPWPAYTADVSKIRIAARFEPEKGDMLYPPESRITLDTSVPGGNSWVNQPLVPTAQLQPVNGPNLLGGPPPAAGPGLGVMTPPTATQAPPMGTLQPVSADYGRLMPAGPGVGGVPQQVDPSNLPPLALTVPRRDK